jgi:disulfide bond formation protein DsbB
MCWFQRICMYPLAVILLIGSVRRDEGVWKYAVAIAAIGLLFSLYHYQLEMFPEQKTFCTSAVPCSARLVNEFGFISLAFMAGAGFISVLALAGARARARRIEE